MENEKIEKMISAFQQLPEEGQSYILGISQALLFAQKHFAEGKRFENFLREVLDIYQNEIGFKE